MSQSAAASEGLTIPTHKARKAEPPLHNPDPTFCSYYVTRKHRFCRTECRPGSLYCCTHDTSTDAVAPSQRSTTPNVGDAASSALPDTAVAEAREVRVPCPINPNHTVYASRLEKHMKVCPDLRYVTDQLPYFSRDKHANRGAVFTTRGCGGGEGETSAEAPGQRRTHRDLPADALAALLVKVHECYDACVAPHLVVLRGGGGDDEDGAAASAPEVPTSSPVSARGSLSHGEAVSEKHGPQHTALLRCLSDVVRQSRDADSILAHCSDSRHRGATIPIDGFLEFGAGKGGLSVALQQRLVQRLEKTSAADVAAAPAPQLSSSASSFLAEVVERPPIVVLDMDGFRRKGDARVRHSAVPLRRLRINIKDVDLTRAFLADVRPHPRCDEAAAVAAGESRVMENWAVLGKHLCGACTDFALSCLTEGPELASEAQVRLPVVVIATCCHHRCELKHVNPPEAASSPSMLMLPHSDFSWSAQEFAALASMSSWAVCGEVVDEERRTVGRKCKRIIDQLRVHFLRRLGYTAFQCQYTTRAVTEENVCLVAFQV